MHTSRCCLSGLTDTLDLRVAREARFAGAAVATGGVGTHGTVAAHAVRTQRRVTLVHVCGKQRRSCNEPSIEILGFIFTRSFDRYLCN